ncbi:MAG: hypothetical protein HZA09_03005 [Nitrospirae bacterium]|nr:hypothetical protein [Nitrospirota bacterium]
MVHREMEKGKGFLILYLTPSKSVTPYISEPLQVIEVLPDYTLGGFFGALYHMDHQIQDPALKGIQHHSECGSASSIHEFSIITAFTRYKEKKGFYLNPLEPIKRQELIWEKKGHGISLCVREGFPSYISLRVIPITPSLPFGFHLPLIEMKGEGVIFYRSLPVTKISLSTSSIHIPPSSPLSELPFKSKIFSVLFNLNQVIVAEPKTIKGKVFKELQTGVYGRVI